MVDEVNLPELDQTLLNLRVILTVADDTERFVDGIDHHEEEAMKEIIKALVV